MAPIAQIGTDCLPGLMREIVADGVSQCRLGARRSARRAADISLARGSQAKNSSAYFQIGFDQALRPVSSVTMTRSHGLFASGARETLVRVIAMPLLWLIR